MKLIRYVRAALRGIPTTEMLVKRGMKLGKNCSIAESCSIDYSFCHLISIGDEVKITAGTIILAHDATTKSRLGKTKVGLVKIGNRVFIGVHSVILPGVSIGDDAIVAAGSVISGDVPAGWVVAGVPARKLCTTEEYYARQAKRMELEPENFVV